MNFIKSLFFRVSGWLAKGFATVATKIIELTAPVLTSHDYRVKPHLTAKHWFKFLLGFAMACALGLFLSTCVIVLATIITSVLALALPLLLANLIAVGAASFYLFFVLELSANSMPNEINVVY